MEPELTPALSAGHVTWDEYRVKFLASKGFDEKEVAEKIRNNEDLKLDEESRRAPTPRHRPPSGRWSPW